MASLPQHRIVDTTGTFEAYARKAGLESPITRELLWRERYEKAHPEVFEAFSAKHGSTGGVSALVRELSRVRARVAEATPVVQAAVERAEAALPDLLGVPAEPAPLHVLMVGHFSTNAATEPLGDDLAVFHCLEWFQSAVGAAVLVAHETTHARHRLALATSHPQAAGAETGGGAGGGDVIGEDLAWTIFAEGIASAASRAVVPEASEVDHFWYGHPENDEWLTWCQANRGELARHMAASLDLAEATETFFGGGVVDGHWRVGYELADHLVAGLGRSLPDLVATPPEEARTLVTEALAAY
ncbi:MAG: hypothetical protein ACT4OS_02765 [Acidimicrobiales bacterium]